MNLSPYPKCKFIFFILFIFLLTNLFGLESLSSTSKNLPHNEKHTLLTPQEQKWVQENEVRVGGGPDWAPFDFVDRNGNYTGISNDYLKLISEKTGLRFRVIVDKWNNNLKKIKSKDLDLLHAIYYTKERTKFVDFAAPYLDMLDYFFIREDLDVKNLQDLNGKTVAMPKGYAHLDVLKQEFPHIKVLLVDTFSEAIDAVLEKRADILFDTYAALTYVLKTQGISTIIPFKSYRGKHTIRLYMATSKGNKTLLSIINKGLANITLEESQKIHDKWLGTSDIKQNFNTINLTSKERNWIQNHQKITYSEVNWKPLSIIDNNDTMNGLLGDYLKLIEKKVGLEFEFVPAKSWPDVLKKFKSGDIDITPGAGDDEYQKQLGLLSDKFATFPFVLVTKNSTSFINNLDEFANDPQKVIAVPKYWTSYNYLISQRPDVKIRATQDVFEALELVQSGEAYAFLGHMAVALHYVGTYYPNTLHISGKINFNFNHRILVHTKDTTLLSILNKTIATITQDEKMAIKNRWMSIEVKEATDLTFLWKYIILFLIVLTLFIYWNRKLAKEIQERKIIENALNVEKENLEILSHKLQKAKEEADAANRSKSEFLANMSHEIRTPMNAIIGFTELLNEQLNEPRLIAYVKTIQNASNTLLTLINDILDLSKIEAGKLTIHKTPTNLFNLSNEISSIFMMSVKNKGIDFIVEVEKDLPKGLLIDAIRLRQILFNLIGNAVKFTEHGSIKLSIKSFNVQEHLSKLDLEISVEDSGIGIPQDQLVKIFKAFEQKDGQDNRKFGGTGLGLSISQRLCVMMDGDITVQSQQDQGATFVVHLYNVDISTLNDENHDKKKTTKDEIVFQKATILVADDIEDNRELIIKNFENTDIKIISANDGLEAVSLFKSENPDLILMDIRMPNMDGYEAAREIKKLSNIPIVALTASVMQDENEILKRKNFDGYLRKPVLKNELFEELSHFLKYTTLKHDEKTEPLILLSEKAKLNMGTILDLIEKNVMPLHDKALKSNNISDIKAMGKELERIADEYEIIALKNYTQELYEAIDVFNISQMQSLLKDLRKLIHSISH